MPEEILETYSLEGGLITVSIVRDSDSGILYRLKEKAPDDRTMRIVRDLTQQFLESSVSEETVEGFLRNKRKTMDMGPDIIYYIFRYSLGLLEIKNTGLHWQVHHHTRPKLFHKEVQGDTHESSGSCGS